MYRYIIQTRYTGTNSYTTQISRQINARINVQKLYSIINLHSRYFTIKKTLNTVFIITKIIFRSFDEFLIVDLYFYVIILLD